MRNALLLLLFSLPLQAQVVADSTSHKPLSGTSVLITGLKDTAIITGNDGRFSVKHFPKGDYNITLSYLGYPTHRTRFSIPEGNFQSLPDTLFLSTKGRDLKEVVVISDAPAISIKGDTIEYNTAKFKTKENAVVEDLLQKLPGIRVDRNGTIKAQGEIVQQVLVDGKEFFGSDPAIATKNLPADMIAKVQVLDKQSDMEEFTGIADGKKRKVINLVTKKDRKKGLFGNVSGSLGNNDRYEGGANINSFSGERQLSLLAKANNINRSGFTGGELLQMMMKNPGMMENLPPFVYGELAKLKGAKVEGDISAILRPAGYTDIHYGGINFNMDKWQSSYFYNGSDTRNTFTRDRQNFLADTSYVYQQEGTTRNKNNEHRVEITTEIKPDDKNTIKISPKLNRATYSNSQSENYQSRTIDRKTLLNEGTQNTSSENTNNHVGTNILFMHKFDKKRRTLALSLTPDYYKNNYTSLNHTRSRYYNVPRTEETDQQTKGSSTTGTFSGSINYTEPLTKTLSMQFSEEAYYNSSTTDKIVKDLKEDKIDERFSDNYNTGTFSNRADILLSVKAKKLELSAGTAFEQNKLNGHSTRKGYKVEKSFTALLPHLYIKYKKLELNYSASANMPGMEQLQPLEDNSEAMVTRKGNPALQQEMDHRLSFSFTNSSKDQQRSQYLRMQYNLGRQKITDQVTLDKATGRQLISPVNVNGNYNAGADAGFSFPAGQEGSYINFGMGLSYTNNEKPNPTTVWAFKPEVGYSAYFGRRISLQVKGSAGYNNRHFDLQQQRSWSFNYYISPMFTLPARMVLEVEWDGYTNTGLSAGYNTSVYLLHFSLTKELGKHFSLKLEGRDLLNQNKSIQRLSGNGYLEDVQDNMLGRYGMLGIVYKLKFFPKQKS
ncbi:outer membrane beta-barrel protein [Chitinophaga sp. SYP-B3965]|uniref:outer membrane beta-barrel protein n=1 Tax=Chitinophaga sp. SYP-B3965 TaxID=2663120 RepID=UPI001299DA0B|nr:outer membrane beta-barrel protein [Chitinophaga sp. SYP-B3965]MRG43756.1 outer membrane beta-barrel protein [Chitinophaga sp. SYP-B3965]